MQYNAVINRISQSSNTCKNKSMINFSTFIFEHKRITRQGISMQVHFIVMGVIVQMKY